MASPFKGLLAGISTNNPATLAVDTALNVADLARAGYGYLGHKAGMLSTDELPEPLERSKFPGSTESIREAAGVADGDLAFLAGGLLSPQWIANAVKRGLIKKAPQELGKAYENMKAQGWSEAEIWKAKKVGKAPSGDYFTENSFKVTKADVTKLPKSAANALPFEKAIKYETDDPAMRELLKNVEVYASSGRPDALVRPVTRADGSKGWMLGINPNSSIPIDEAIHHELGHIIRNGDFPTSINMGNFNALNQRLNDYWIKARDITEAKARGGMALKSWEMKGRAHSIAGNEETNKLLRMTPQELAAEEKKARELLMKMEKYVKRDEYDAFRHYKSQQDEQMSRLDQWRSPMSDAEQRDWFPKKQSVNESLEDEYTDVLNWRKIFDEWM